MKRFLAILLAAVLCMSCAVAAFAQPAVSAHLYSIYGNDMLFAEKKPAVFAGTATGGIRVTCTLFDDAGKVVEKASGAVNKSGRFSVSVPAPAGSYREYSVVLELEGVEFAHLTGIVFGALWLSSGQSNMQMNLGASETGIAMQQTGETESRWLRFLFVQPFVEYEGDTERFPLDPQRDIPGSFWLRGDSGNVLGVSAVSVLFARRLQQTLDMPVGVLSTALGGSAIYSWLSRSAIESDAGVLDDMRRIGRYVSESDWKETGHSVTNDMTVNYNKKIEALRVFSPAGLIWYQGETEVFQHVEPQMYARAFELLQTSWSQLFGYTDGARMPVIYTQLASYPYSDDYLQQMNLGFADMQNAQPDSRAMISLYDVPLTYRVETGTIHPTEKLPVAERMAYAAEGLVYGLHGTYTAATVQSSRIADGSVQITLRNTGEGLVCEDGRLRGFSICGADGVFVQADAEITGKDTLSVSAPEVPQPVAAAYAFSEFNGTANLYASDENGKTMPVSAFVTDPDALLQSWQNKEWADCDDEKIWRYANDQKTGFYDTWSAQDAALTYADGEEGKCLSVTAEKRSFSVWPTDRYADGRKERAFADARPDYSRYSTVTFRVRNTGNADVTLQQVRLYTSSVRWFAPLVNDTGRTACTIPADGQWHTVTLDLQSLYRFGNTCGVTYTRAMLGTVERLRLCFAGDAGDTVQLDSFRFTPDGSQIAKRQFVPHFERASSPIDWLCAIGMFILSRFVR